MLLPKIIKQPKPGGASAAPYYLLFFFHRDPDLTVIVRIVYFFGGIDFELNSVSVFVLTALREKLRTYLSVCLHKGVRHSALAGENGKGVCGYLHQLEIAVGDGSAVIFNAYAIGESILSWKALSFLTLYALLCHALCLLLGQRKSPHSLYSISYRTTNGVQYILRRAFQSF